MTKETVEQLRAAADVERTKNIERVDAYFKLLVPTGYTVRNNISLDAGFKHINYYIEPQFIQPDGKESFGADFRLRYENKFVWHDDEDAGKPVLAMDTGSLGLTSFEDNPERWAQFEMMGNVFDHREEIIALLDSLPTEAQHAFHEADLVYQREQREIEKQAEEAKKQQIISELTVGKTYTDEDVSGYQTTERYTYTVEKITPKRVYLRYVRESKAEHSVYDDQWNHIGHRIDTTTYTGTAYIKYDSMVSCLYHMGEKYAYHICASLEGVSEQEESCVEGKDVISD